VLADLAVRSESRVFEGGEHTVVEEAGRYVAGGFRVALDGATAETGDQFERAGECSGGDSLAAMAFADVAAGDPPVGKLVQLLLVLLAVLDARYLVGWPELAPADAVIAVEDQRRVRGPGPDAVEFLLPVRLRGVEVGGFFGVEAHAPAAAEDAAVGFHQRRERIPRRHVECLDGEVGGLHRSPGRIPRSSPASHHRG